MIDRRCTVVPTPGFLLEEFDSEFTVYHPTLTTSLYLNETGALIWRMCAADYTIAEMIKTLQKLYPESSKQIAADVCTLLDKLVEKKIVTLA